MTAAPSIARAPASAQPLPDAVCKALRRVAVLVVRHQGGYLVAGEPTVDTEAGLADALYLHWYTQPPAPVGREPAGRRRSMVAALRAAHALAGLSSESWIVLSAQPNGLLVAAVGERTRVLRPGEYAGQCRPGVPLAPGEPLRAVERMDRIDAEHGFWWTFTEQPPQPPLGRLYLDVRPSLAARVVREVTSVLAALAVPHQLKCPLELEDCRRVDAMVVYHPRERRAALIEGLCRRWPTLGPLLDAAVPPLTCEVAPGLSWAEDDGGSQHSFGETRCRALAATLIGAGVNWSPATVRQRVLLLADGLRAAGVDPAQPWLAAG